MALRDLLVHVDDTPAAARRVALAAELARRHGAHLAGLYLQVEPTVPGYVMAELPGETLDWMHRNAVERAEAAEALFRRTVDAAGIPAEWRRVATTDPEVAAVHGRYVDLNIAGQDDPDAPPALPGVTEAVLLGSGRPTLVVPYAGTFASLGDNVLVAWNAGREAARAVGDALPLIAEGARITVLAVDPDATAAGGAGVPGADIALHLARHGRPVEASHIVSDDVSPSDLLLSRAADLGTDLLVMGAYGHSRLREVVLGGVTREILQHMTVPVLMSH
ncbi:MAG: universal stress protein [Alphaproteobacteria bacterium]